MDGGYQPEHGGFEPGRVRGRPSRSEYPFGSEERLQIYGRIVWQMMNLANIVSTGNATDIGATYVRYLENRRPKHQGVRGFESERHSLSYVFDVWSDDIISLCAPHLHLCRCCHLLLAEVSQSIRFPLGIFIPP